jgi:hypothetical protein
MPECAEGVPVAPRLVEGGKLLDRKVLHMVPAEVLAVLGQQFVERRPVFELGGGQNLVGYWRSVRALKMNGLFDASATVHGFTARKGCYVKGRS